MPMIITTKEGFTISLPEGYDVCDATEWTEEVGSLFVFGKEVHTITEMIKDLPNRAFRTNNLIAEWAGPRIQPAEWEQRATYLKQVGMHDETDRFKVLLT